MNLKELLRQISSHPDYLQASSIQSEATKFTSRQTLPDLKTMISDLSKLTYGTCLESEEVNYILDTFSPLLEKSDKITKIIISCIGNICVGTKLPILQRIIKILSTKLFNETDTTV